MVHVEVDVSQRGPRSTISFPLVGYDGSIPPYVDVLDFHGESWSDTFPGQMARKQESSSRCIDLKIQLQYAPVHKPLQLQRYYRVYRFTGFCREGKVNMNPF